MKTFKKRKQTRKQKRKQKGGMWFTQNIDKSCEDNLKDFNRTRYRRPPNEPYNPTTYYPGLFNVHSKPVQQSMHCTNSDTPIPQTKFSNECREVNRFLVSNYKQKRSEEFLLYGFYCCFNPTTCEIDYYRCTRVFHDDEQHAFGEKVILNSHPSASNGFSFKLDMVYYNSLHTKKNSQKEDIEEAYKSSQNDVELLYEINIPGKQIPYKDKYGNPIYEIELFSSYFIQNRQFYIVGKNPNLLPIKVSPLMTDY